MRLGLTTAIFAEHTLEQVLELAAQAGLASVEVACWPRGRAERRYAGVTHIDAGDLTDSAAESIKEAVSSSGVDIGALVYSPNFLAADDAAREVYTAHFKNVIYSARKLGVPSVQTFIGKDKARPIEDNMEAFRRVWPDLIRFACDNGVIVTFENCPMYFTKDEWPGGNNLAASPKLWREMFAVIDSENFGMTYDPSHLVWQRMDYIKPIYEFKDKIINVHAKDAKFYQDKFDELGVFAHPLEYHAPKLPGLGDIDWGRVMSALTDTGFDGNMFIEIEDRAFESCERDRIDAVMIARNFLGRYLP